MNILYFNAGISDKILKTKQSATYKFWELDDKNQYYAFQHLDEKRFRKIVPDEMYKFMNVKDYYITNSWIESYAILDKIVETLNPKMLFVTSNRIYRQRGADADDLLTIFEKTMVIGNENMLMNFMMYRNFYKNAMAVLYLSIMYDIPVRYVILDPLEWTYDRIVEDSQNYHFYDYEASNAKFLPFIEYGYFYKKRCALSMKDIDFVFGLTILTENRLFMQGKLAFMEKTIEESKIRSEIYLKDKFKNVDNFVPYNQYIERLKHAKFTLMIPSYDNNEFSSGRFFEALACDCLPLISKNVYSYAIDKAFEMYPRLLDITMKYLRLDDDDVVSKIKSTRYEDVLKEIKECPDYKKLCDIEFYKKYLKIFLS